MLVTHLLQIKQILCACCSLWYPVVIDLLRGQIVFVHQQHRCTKVKPAEGRDKFTAELMADEHTQVDSPTGQCVPEWKGHWMSRERALRGRSGFVCEGVLLTAYLTSALQALQIVGGEEWNQFYSLEPIKRVKTCWKWICVRMSQETD